MAFGPIGRLVWEVRKAIHMRGSRREQAQNDGVFGVRYDNDDIGFFAQLQWCTEVLFHCDEQGLVPYLELVGASYRSPDRDPNWLEYFFVQRKVTPEIRAGVRSGRIVVSRVRVPDFVGFPCNYNEHLDFPKAHSLFHEYLEIRPEILEYVEAYWRKHFTGRQVLGLHFRSGDKLFEAVSINRTRVRDCLRKYLNEHPDYDCLCLASDEDQCDKYFQAQFPELVVVQHGDLEKADGMLPVHHKGYGDPYRKGFEALVNCLLLSRCGALLKSASFLSGWSKVFSPGMETLLMNRTQVDCNWFPDRDIPYWRGRVRPKPGPSPVQAD